MRAVLAALNLERASLSRIGLGLSSEAWLVEEATRRSVLRIALPGRAWPSTYRTEHAIMAELAARGGPVPAPIVGSWEVAGWPGVPWSLTTYAPGVSLQPGSRLWAAPLVASFVAMLRAVPVTGFGPIGDGDTLTGLATDPLAGLHAWMDGDPLWPFDGTSLADHPALSGRADLVRALEQQAGVIEDSARSGPVALIHADLHEENILEDGRRLTFIDFGEAFIGARDWEPATLAYFMGWEFADRAIAGQGLAHHAAALALSFGVHRWRQDRRLGLDEDAYDESFLRSTLARMAGPDVEIAANNSSRT